MKKLLTLALMLVLSQTAVSKPLLDKKVTNKVETATFGLG